MKYLEKKSLFVSILFFSISSLLIAQDGENKRGIKGAINFSNFNNINNDVDDQNLRVGFQAGLYFKLALTDFLAIQPELLYTTKGATYDYNLGALGDGELTQKFGYLQVPLLAVVNLGEKLNVHAGPYIAYMLNAKVENNSSESTLDYTNEFDAGDFERFEYGLSVGFAFEFQVLKIGGRYDYGMSEVGEEQNFNVNNSQVSSNIFKDEKNSVFSIFMGIGF